MDHSTGEFSSLLLVITLALIAPLLAHSLRRWRLPVVVIEIAVGAVFGGSGLGFIVSESHISFLSSFGFAYLMFLSGLEMDVQDLLPSRDSTVSFWKSSIVLASGRLIVVFILALSGSLILKKMGLIKDSLFVAFLICNTSVGIVVSVLKEYGVISTQGGQITLTATLLADLLSVFALSSYVAFSSSSRGEIEFFMILILLFSAILIYRFIKFGQGRSGWLDSAFQTMSHSTSQIHLRASFALLLFFIAFAEFMGTEVMLGALLSGIVMSILLGREGEQLKEKLDIIGYGFFVPIFFIMVGANLDLSVLFKSSTALPLIGLLLFIVLVVNIAGAAFLVGPFGLRNGMAYGLIMTTRLALTVAGASIGMQAGLITSTTKSALIILSVLTCVMGPALFLKLYRAKAGENEDKLWLVAGNSLGALDMAEHIMSSEVNVILVTSSKRLQKLGERSNVKILFEASGSPQNAYKRIGIVPDGVVLSIKGRRKTVEIARVLRYHYGIEKIIAIVKDDRTATLLDEIGIVGISARKALTTIVRQSVNAPALFSALSDERYNIIELTTHLNGGAGPTIDEALCRLPQGGVLLLLSRGGEVLPPSEDTLLMDGDILTIKCEACAGEKVNLINSISPDRPYSFKLKNN